MTVKAVGVGAIAMIAGLMMIGTSSFASQLGWAFIAGGALGIAAGLASAAS